VIVATAGHVDHGKTLLIRALTGVDTDRLPEEKQRGMTIDLGFAYWRIGGGLTIGFVDVPGHERFIRNMLCGVAGVDFALLVVAADDGVMPQTREHVAILDLLGMARGAVALTKIDRVAPDRVEGVAQEVRALLTPTALRAVPLFPVSAATGDGIAALSAHLQETAQRTPPRPAKGNFRLAIDRAFTIAGAGLVVTGAIFSGAVAVGDTVRVLGADRIARVRALHAQNREERAAQAGERCALNLSGADLTLEQLERGDWITGPDAPAPVKKFDARLRLLPSEARALAHWTPVHLHLGAADVSPCSKATPWRRAKPASSSSFSTGRSARCAATASSCATSRPGARLPAALSSTSSRRHAAARGRSGFCGFVPWSTTITLARLTNSSIARQPASISAPLRKTAT